MITKEYLNEYEKNMRNYEHEIQKIQYDLYIENRNKTVDSVSGSLTVPPYTQTHIKIEGINTTRIKKLEKRKKIFENKKDKLQKEFDYKLNCLDDRIVADIIELRYKKKMSWQKISWKLRYTEESGARNCLNRYLKNQ